MLGLPDLRQVRPRAEGSYLHNDKAPLTFVLTDRHKLKPGILFLGIAEIVVLSTTVIRMRLSLND
jgi:hypothetical protein